jgi:predicted DCC family thiol-disulfide oxidoreductase YuxK
MTDAIKPTQAAAPALTVFFDGSCPLCRAEIGVYQKCIGAEQIAFVDVAPMADGQVAGRLSQADAMTRFHVMQADGTLASGAAGFAQLWLALPGWAWLGRLIRLPFVLPVAEVLYRLFLRVRPLLQRIWRWRFPNASRAP